jgi:3-dehydroquinate synthase
MFVKKTLNCSILSPPIHYEIVIGEKLMESALQYAKALSHQTLVITTDVVNTFLNLNKEERLILPSGESIKSRAIKEKIEDALIERGWGRESCLVGIGGGALLDLVGFVAATYCRGIPYVSAPTTLLAMTDAAIGGKTGVNVEEAKNWIGSFHHPKKIFIDLTLLKTLPDKQFLYGLAETIKHGLIADSDLFSFLENHAEEILGRKSSILQEMVLWSCSIKKGIVEKDPYERDGYRRILNFGHTIGHAIESLSEYQFPHGQAIVMGMRIEAEIAKQMDYLSRSSLVRFDSLLKRFQFKMDYPKCPPYEMLKRDKKGAHRFVVITSIGSVAPFEGSYVLPLSKKHLEAAWKNVVGGNKQ